MNLRPPGYEPDELPTALLRDIGALVQRPIIVPRSASFVKAEFVDRFLAYSHLSRPNSAGVWKMLRPRRVMTFQVRKWGAEVFSAHL